MRSKLLLIGALGTLLHVQITDAKLLGRIGAVYPIKEKDALTEIEDRARAVDWNKVLDKKKIVSQMKALRPEGLAHLPRAKRDRRFQVDMTFTLTYDIPDGRGGILYPKGYTFNPLELISYPYIQVYINGDDRKQIEWFNSSPYAKDDRVRLNLVDGSHFEVSRKLGRQVFYATPLALQRLKLVAVPSAVMQQGKMMEVSEYAIR